jgi:hypothetical protein
LEPQQRLFRRIQPIFPAKLGRIMLVWGVLSASMGIADWVIAAPRGEIEKNSDDFRLFAKLSTPITSIVDGRSFRSGIERIAQQAEVNVVISRKVDPSRRIRSGPLGPTVYLALRKMAADHDCVVMPVRSVVLVGKADWVDSMATVLNKTPRSKRVDISWPRLTTPEEAFAIVSKADPANIEIVNPEIDHDLWPAVDWKQIESSIAAQLIIFQMADRFDLPNSLRAKTSRQRIDLDRKLSKAAEKIKISDPLESSFSLTTRTRAASVLRQLCAAAGRQCVIESDAITACDRIVSISENDVTLRRLIEVVAEQAGVHVILEKDRATVSVEK